MACAERKWLRHKSSETTGKGLERAQEILEAARDIFASEGYAKLTMRGVASRVGVPLGNLQHYYRTREALLEAMLLHALEDWQARADYVATSQQGDPELQFRAAMRYFTRVVRSRVAQGTLVELKALSLHSSFAADVLERILLRARKSIGRRIQAVAPDVDGRDLNLRSALVMSQLLGLTYLEPGSERRPAAHLRGLEEAMLDDLLAVAKGTGGVEGAPRQQTKTPPPG